MRARAVLVLLLAGGVPASVTLAQAPAPAGHVVVTPDAIAWKPGPPFFRPGAQSTVIYGDMSQAGPYVARMKAPAGFKIMPHWHPSDENVTVLSGTVAMGTGDTIDEKTAHELTAGSFMRVPAQTHHYFVARTDTIIQVHGTGPFSITYVNPADDPRAAAAKP